ncbi:hypothetical protein AB0I80_54815 [Nonomuraea rubra]
MVEQTGVLTGVLTGRTRRALDSAVLLDAVAAQDTITQLIAAIRRVARQVPGASALIAAHAHAHDYTDPGRPRIAWDDEEAKNTLVSGLVTDALTLLDHLNGQDLDEPAEHAIGLLALIAALAAAGHRLLIKPPALTPAVIGGFTLDDFTIDTAAGTVACPAGHTVALAAPGGRYQQRRATFTG